MNYRAFFNSPTRLWTKIYNKPPEWRSNDGYLMALEYDAKHSSYVWNLYKSTTTCVDDDVCIAHNVPDEFVNNLA